ncbi:MAG: HNH endonuclease [Candidatus Eremiobacteraeota bacterium]|nr:HNH endonuclease [Candidatus Eremiobacteraeota bacterium]
MAILEKDVKLLWGFAANRCAIPECRRILAQNPAVGGGGFTIGEMAHIVAEQPGGPRGDSALSDRQRNSYSNLILLCPTHHRIVDQDIETYTVSVLHSIKDEHETWVADKLSPTDPKAAAAEYLYADLVDFVSMEFLERWDDITFGPMSPSPYFRHANIEIIRSFRERTLRTPWPKTYPAFETASIRLGFVLATALEHFQVHSDWSDFFEKNGATIWAEKFYKQASDNDDYEKLVAEYNGWVERLHELMREATKAANWFSDCVRALLNPRFRLIEGYALTSEDQGLSVTHVLYRYEPDEIQAVIADPYGNMERAKTWLERLQARAGAEDDASDRWSQQL